MVDPTDPNSSMGLNQELTEKGIGETKENDIDGDDDALEERVSAKELRYSSQHHEHANGQVGDATAQEELGISIRTGLASCRMRARAML